METESLTRLLIHARRAYPIRAGESDRLTARMIRRWSPTGGIELQRHGVWANDPVPLYSVPVLARLPQALGRA